MTKYRYEQNRVYLGSDDVIAMCSNEAMAKALTQAANAMCKVDGQIKDCDSVAPTYLYDSLRAVRHLKIKCEVIGAHDRHIATLPEQAGPDAGKKFIWTDAVMGYLLDSANKAGSVSNHLM